MEFVCIVQPFIQIKNKLVQSENYRNNEKKEKSNLGFLCSRFDSNWLVQTLASTEICDGKQKEKITNEIPREMVLSDLP